jgi:DNA-binding GntR family transcriptional regulator
VVQILTKGEKLYQELKEEIIAGKLRPGERLLLSDLALRYQVSPMPIREALQRLQQDNFVTIVPHVGARVVSPNLQDFKELAAIRTELEPFAARLAVLFIEESSVRKLEELVQAMETSIQENNKRRYSSLNREFHTTLYAASQNKQLFSLILNIWDKSKISGRIFAVWEGIGRYTQSLQDHKEILAAIVAKDPDKAATIIRTHNERAFKLVIAALEEESAEAYSERVSAGEARV